MYIFFTIIAAKEVETSMKEERWVKVPKIYWNFTRKVVLTMEWIDGIKLNNEVALNIFDLNQKELIDKV